MEINQKTNEFQKTPQNIKQKQNEYKSNLNNTNNNNNFKVFEFVEMFPNQIKKHIKKQGKIDSLYDALNKLKNPHKKY